MSLEIFWGLKVQRKPSLSGLPSCIKQIHLTHFNFYQFVPGHLLRKNMSKFSRDFNPSKLLHQSMPQLLCGNKMHIFVRMPYTNLGINGAIRLMDSFQISGVKALWFFCLSRINVVMLHVTYVPSAFLNPQAKLH